MIRRDRIWFFVRFPVSIILAARPFENLGLYMGRYVASWVNVNSPGCDSKRAVLARQMLASPQDRDEAPKLGS
jgi:hypothetical protein